jgi:hypothetical protein
MGDIATKLQSNTTKDDIPEAVLTSLEQIMNSLISHCSDAGDFSFLSSEHVLRMLDVFNYLKKVEICKVSDNDE